MSKKRQIFYRESTLRFHLRAPKSSRPTLIFLATCIDGKRYKISTKVRVYSSQWDQERQLAVVSNVQSKQDNRNIKIANNQLNKLRGCFSEFIEYISSIKGKSVVIFMERKRGLPVKTVHIRAYGSVPAVSGG